MEINEKCELLESLGFEILHETSRVKMGQYTFDFSATNMEAGDIIYTALQTAYKVGQRNGKAQMQERVKYLFSDDFLDE